MLIRVNITCHRDKFCIGSKQHANSGPSQGGGARVHSGVVFIINQQPGFEYVLKTTAGPH